MRIWFEGDDINADVEDWLEVELYHAAWMDAPSSILTGGTLQLDITTDDTRPEFGSWQETIRRD